MFILNFKFIYWLISLIAIEILPKFLCEKINNEKTQNYNKQTNNNNKKDHPTTVHLKAKKGQ